MYWSRANFSSLRSTKHFLVIDGWKDEEGWPDEEGVLLGKQDGPVDSMDKGLRVKLGGEDGAKD